MDLRVDETTIRYRITTGNPKYPVTSHRKVLDLRDTHGKPDKTSRHVTRMQSDRPMLLQAAILERIDTTPSTLSIWASRRICNSTATVTKDPSAYIEDRLNKL